MSDKNNDNSSSEFDQINQSINIFPRSFYKKNQSGIYEIRVDVLYTIIILLVLLLGLYNNRQRFSDIKNKHIKKSNCPPSILIDALIAPERAIDMQVNLAEVFPLWVARHGLSFAH